MRPQALLALGGLCLALGPVGLGAQSDTPPLEGGRVVSEVGAGLLAMPIGFVIGGIVTERIAEGFGASDQRASQVALVGAYTGAALATATGPWLVGTRGRVTGSYAATLGGAVAGGLGSYVLVRIFDDDDDSSDRPCRLVCSLATVAIFALPSVGATIGFNLSRKYE